MTASPPTVADALNWHAALSRSVAHHRAETFSVLRGGPGVVEPNLLGLTSAEVDAFFREEQNELDALCVVSIVAAAEAVLRSDYRERVRRNKSDGLSRAYVAFSRLQTGRKQWLPDFDRQGILDILKSSGAVPGHLVTDFRKALMRRHWCAHGRAWLTATDLPQDPADIYQACNNLLVALPQI